MVYRSSRGCSACEAFDEEVCLWWAAVVDMFKDRLTTDVSDQRGKYLGALLVIIKDIESVNNDAHVEDERHMWTRMWWDGV